MNDARSKRLAKLAARRKRLLKNINPRADEIDSAKKSPEFVAQKWLIPADAVIHDPTDLEDMTGHILIEKNVKTRRFISGEQLEELSHIVPDLPSEDVDYHIIANGRGVPVKKNSITQSFGFGSYIGYVVERFGVGCSLDLSTWSMNPDHVLMILELLDSGKLARVRILIDRSLVNRKKEVVATLTYGFRRFPSSRVAVIRNHSKVCCIKDLGGSRFCTITGSANLSGALRPENYVISTSPELYEGYLGQFFNPVFG